MEQMRICSNLGVVFLKFVMGKTCVVTATSDNKGDSKASVGKAKGLRYQNSSELALEEGSRAVYGETLVENLVSVGKLCDLDQTVVFDQYGCVVTRKVGTHVPACILST